MEKEKTLTITYKDDDIVVEINKQYYILPTFVHIYTESSTGKTNRFSLTKSQALRLLTILSIANEEAEI